MDVLGFVRKTATRVVLGQESRLRCVRKDAAAFKQIRNQREMIFRVRVSEKPWNSERTMTCSVEGVDYGPIRKVIESAISEFGGRYEHVPHFGNLTISVEAVLLPNLTNIEIPERFWKKYLPNDMS